MHAEMVPILARGDVMAGKFLSIDEVAQRLGTTTDEVNRLVDRKKLFPMRDGASVKFKADDVDRLAAELADEKGSEDSESIQLDLDDGGAAGGPRTGSGLGAGQSGLKLADDDWALGEADAGGVDGSRTLVGSADDKEAVSLFDDAALGGNDDLLLESVASASSPALSGLDELTIDDAPRGTVELPGAAGPAASGIAGLSDPSAIGAALSGPLESGISLEDGDLKGSGIDLEIGSGIGGAAAGSGIDIGGDSGIGGASALAGGSGIGGPSGIGGGSLVGDQFDLGGVGDDDSASVVVATESTGDSSFFGAAVGDDSASVSFDESASSSFDAATAAVPGGDFEYSIDTTFNAWQIVGLVCCSLVLFFAGLVMFDLAWTIRSPGGTPFSAPLIGGLTQIFGWQ